MILSAGTKDNGHTPIPRSFCINPGGRGSGAGQQIRAKKVLHNKQAMLEVLSTNTGFGGASKDSDRMSYLTLIRRWSTA